MLSTKKLFLCAGLLTCNSSASMPLQSEPSQDGYSVTIPVPPSFEEVLDRTITSFKTDFRHRVEIGDNNGTLNQCFTHAGKRPDLKEINFIRSQAPKSQDYNLAPIIVLDPGHGSELRRSAFKYDTGAIRNKLQEAKVVDAIVEPLVERLRTELHAHVVTTRDPLSEGVSLTHQYQFRDQDRMLQYRAELAETLQKKFPDYPVILVSVHINAEDGGTSLKGSEVYYYPADRGNRDSLKLAHEIAESFKLRPGTSTDVRTKSLGVLRCAPTGVLFETGYLSNPEDFKVLKAATHNPEKAGQLAGMIADGIASYLDDKRAAQKPSPQMLMASNDKAYTGPR